MTEPTNSQVDGYYSEDEFGNEELDLSFLDDDKSTDNK